MVNASGWYEEWWRDGVLEYRGDGLVESRDREGLEWLSDVGLGYLGVMGTERRNRNRGYQRLRVWQDAIKLYAETCRLVAEWPFEMKRIASQAMASADSVHRNIAEGYCCRSIREYIHYLYIALGSLGESVAGYHAYLTANQLSKEAFETLDQLAFKLENGLLRLVEALERKQDAGGWIDMLIVRESNAVYLGMTGNSP
jgi:four helix bundle protein